MCFVGDLLSKEVNKVHAADCGCQEVLLMLNDLMHNL